MNSKTGFTPLEKVPLALRRGGRNRESSLTGFTLMELVVACVILALGLTVALQVYLNISSLVIQSRNKTIATTHAKCILEEIRYRGNMTTIEIFNEDWFDWLNGLSGVDLLPGEAVPTIDTNSTLNVPVTISWNEKNRLCNVTLTGGFRQ